MCEIFKKLEILEQVSGFYDAWLVLFEAQGWQYTHSHCHNLEQYCFPRPALSKTLIKVPFLMPILLKKWFSRKKHMKFKPNAISTSLSILSPSYLRASFTHG